MMVMMMMMDLRNCRTDFTKISEKRVHLKTLLDDMEFVMKLFLWETRGTINPKKTDNFEEGAIYPQPIKISKIKRALKHH